MSKKTNFSYIGISFIVLVFGIIFIPKIIDRVSQNDITRDDGRSKNVSISDEYGKGLSKSDLSYLMINGQPKKVPTFSFTLPSSMVY